MKSLTLGAGHLCVPRSPWGMNVKLYLKYFIYWTADVKSSKLWSSQLWTQFYAIAYEEAWKIQDFNGVWTRDLAIKGAVVAEDKLNDISTCRNNRLNKRTADRWDRGPVAQLVEQRVAMQEVWPFLQQCGRLGVIFWMDCWSMSPHNSMNRQWSNWRGPRAEKLVSCTLV